MSYTITITENITKTVNKDGNWCVVDKRLWTAEEFRNKTTVYNETKFLEEQPLKEVYGYSPAQQVTVNETKEIFKQILDDLNMPAIIRAANSI